MIGYNTSIDSDFNNLKINPEYDNRDRIITFSKGYVYKNQELIDYEFVYFYSSDLNMYSTQIIEFNCYKYDSIEDDNYNKSKSNSIFASIISSDENIYKAVILSDTSKIFDNSKLYFYSYIVRDINNVITQTIEFGLDCLFRYDLNNENNNIWSCVVYDLIRVEVKGVIGYFQFEPHKKVNPFGLIYSWGSPFYQEKYVDLFFAFFDVIDNGVEWDDSKTIHRIDYSITETKKEITKKYRYEHYYDVVTGVFVDKYKLDSTNKKIISFKTYQDSVINYDYKFTFPVNLTLDNFDVWLKNGFVIKKEVVYSGIWKTSDTRLSDNFKLSSGYDSSLLVKYNYACRIGLPSGYPRSEVSTGVYQEWLTNCYDEIITYYDVEVDFDYIYYKENGESFIIKVDKTTLKDIGYIGNEEDIEKGKLPIHVDYYENPFNIWNILASIFATGLLFVLIVFVLKIVKFFRDLKLCSDVRRMKKKNNIK